MIKINIESDDDIFEYNLDEILNGLSINFNLKSKAYANVLIIDEENLYLAIYKSSKILLYCNEIQLVYDEIIKYVRNMFHEQNKSYNIENKSIQLIYIPEKEDAGLMSLINYCALTNKRKDLKNLFDEFYERFKKTFYEYNKKYQEDDHIEMSMKNYITGLFMKAQINDKVIDVKKNDIEKRKISKAKYYGTGRRKNSIARVYLVPGNGKIIINKKGINDYFGLETLKLIVRQPLVITDTLHKFDVLVNVKGGGFTGQASAIRHGISRALLQSDADFRTALKKAGFLSRDPRIKDEKMNRKHRILCNRKNIQVKFLE